MCCLTDLCLLPNSLGSSFRSAKLRAALTFRTKEPLPFCQSSEALEHSSQIKDILHLHILGTMSRRQPCMFYFPAASEKNGHAYGTRTHIFALRGRLPKPVRRRRDFQKRYLSTFSIIIIAQFFDFVNSFCL